MPSTPTMFCLLLPVLLLAACPLAAQIPSNDPDAASWVDSVFHTMNRRAKIAQLIMVRAHSDKGPEHTAQVMEWIERYGIGGLCFFQGTPSRQISLLNQYQERSRIPLLVAIDGEWSLGMRLKETMSFPRQLMLGAVQDNTLIYRMGREVGQQMKRVGVHINFAPVADVNNNAANPVIHTRSFGEDKENVTRKCLAYMQGMQEEGILACAKHFPGHGDTNVDSHYALPQITHSRERLEELEFYPFRELAKQGVASFMLAHLNIPALDNRPNRPSTLSRPIVTGIVREAMGFQGLLFTDALEMKGVTQFFEKGIVEAEALLAGNDILLLPEDIPAALDAIEKYMDEGKIDISQVDASVRRVLQAKYKVGLSNFHPIAQVNLYRDLHKPSAISIRQTLIREAITLVRNERKILPLKRLDTLSLASLSIGAEKETPFQRRLAAYAPMPALQAAKDLSPAERDLLLSRLAGRECVIIGIHDMNTAPAKDFGLTAATLDLIRRLDQQTTVVLVVFGTPYSLRHFESVPVLISAYEADSTTQDYSAQAIFGAIGMKGKLPVSASAGIRSGIGLNTRGGMRIGYAAPELHKLNTDTLQHLRQIIRHAIDIGATPGAVVLVAKDGDIVFEEAFGYHDYTRTREVQTDDIYDLASITKAMATTLAVMKLDEQGIIDIDQPLSRYLPELLETNKNAMTIADIMAHRAGLQNFIKFFEKTLLPGKPPQLLPQYYQASPSPAFTIPVTERLFLRTDFRDSILHDIYRSPLDKPNRYQYSDLGFYLLAEMVARLTGKPLDVYVHENFYQPLGLHDTGFNPWKWADLGRVAPTEEDSYFRGQKLHGYVHDMGAAMLGGVSGHAGLFSSARDLAILLQVMLFRGEYGGMTFFQPQTIQKFTSHHPKSIRRGIGWDMQQPRTPTTHMSSKASYGTFGHTGFTGPVVWSDPRDNLTLVFLTNRTYPTMRNGLLTRLYTRRQLHGTLYRALPSFAGEASDTGVTTVGN